jgi:glycine betaine transporter
LTDWTYFYWAFWLAWAPFTGVFIARISKGRTIRQFILATLIIPSIGTFIWFSAFGTNAFSVIGETTGYQGEFDSIYSAIFVFFNQYPFAVLTNTVAFMLIFTFLITSIDSAIFVLGMFSDGGREEPRKRFRLIWGVILGLFTLAVVLVGKDALLASVSQMLILFALPFSFLFLVMIVYFLFNLNSKAVLR